YVDPVVAIIDNAPRKLIVIKALSGNIVSQSELPARVVGLPAKSFSPRAAFLIAYETGDVELRDKTGAKIRAGSAGDAATTGPIVVKGRQQDLVLLGTRQGLTAMTAADLKPLGRVTIKDDS